MEITTKIINEFIRLYNEGHNCCQIARRYGVAQTTVLKYLKLNGIKTTRSIPHHKFYKNKYRVYIYDRDDNLRWIFDNSFEMVKYFSDLSRRSIDNRLNYHFKTKSQKEMFYKGEWFRIFFIEADKEELDD